MQFGYFWEVLFFGCNAKYADICGISEDEVRKHFKERKCIRFG